MVNRFYCSEQYTVDPETLRINHPTKDVNESLLRRNATDSKLNNRQHAGKGNQP